MTETTTLKSPIEPSPAQLRAAEAFVPLGGRIVVGVDGSPASLQALRTAARIAELTGGCIEAVAVPDTDLRYGSPEVAALLTDPEEDGKALLAEAKKAVFGDQPPAALHSWVRFGGPAKQILEQAQGAALIVVGNRGHGGLAGLLLGSVSTKCAAGAKCPVLIVHAPEPSAA